MRVIEWIGLPGETRVEVLEGMEGVIVEIDARLNPSIGIMPMTQLWFKESELELVKEERV